ncbi:MAG: molybdopterin-binding protein [Chloroflexota bacterium]|jgi:molybdenum cofactor cytidylyltransferase
MKFGPIPIAQAKGKILGHNIAGSDGRRALRKGHPLTTADITLLQQLGKTAVYVAQLEPDDIGENEAAAQLAQAVMGPGLRLSGPATGRANLYSDTRGLLRVDVERLARFNSSVGLTLATLPTHTALSAGKMVATLKIIPYALPGTTVETAVAIARDGGPLLSLDPLPQRRVGLILSGSLPAQERVARSFQNALGERLSALGSAIRQVDYVPLEDEADEQALATAIRRHHQAGLDLVILAGETAIMDRYDIAPRAVERAGGIITCFGAPVDPGNLLLLAYLDRLPILGAPGCARSPKDNIVDLVLPRLLVGDRLTQADIIDLGHGGLMEDVPERPLPRSRL